MKFNLKYIVPGAAMLLTLGLSSCVGDLDVTPKDPTTNMELDVEGLFNKCYANMAVQGQDGGTSAKDCDIDGYDGGTVGFIRQMFNSNELTSDEAICGWGDTGIPAYNFNQFDASHPMLEGYYYRLITGVTYCNHYLEVASSHDATMTAEVRFLRALYYYFLMDAFGNVPFVEKLSAENAPQIKRADLYAWIEKELLDCEKNLSAPSVKFDTNVASGEDGYGRADKSAAWFLLSRLYLNAEVYTGTPQWEKAAEYSKKVINESGRSLWTGTSSNNYSAYQMLFMGDNGQSGAANEVILPIMQDGIYTTAWCSTLFLIASTWQTDMVNSQGESVQTTETWAGNRARPDLVRKFFPNDDAPNGTTKEMVTAAKDDRALFWGKDRSFDIPDNGTGTASTKFVDGFSVAKYVNTYSDGSQPHSTKFCDTDFFLFRMGEAYLNYAEALMRAAGGTMNSEAKTYLDAIRTRAHATPLTKYTLGDVLAERSRELYFEGTRRSDLIRFGCYGGQSAYTWTWMNGSYEGSRFSADRNLFAIPSSDINANPKLTQNPGYQK